MNVYSIGLKVNGRPCLVIGGGRIALPKARHLAECGARVTVVSPRFEEGFQDLNVTCVMREFEESDLDGMFLAIAATDDPAVNRRAGEVCRHRGVLCNVVDDPEACDFFLNAAVRRGEFQIAVSTGGTSPALAKRVRRELEERFPEDYGEYVAFLGRIREELRARNVASALRSRVAAALASEEAYHWFRTLRDDSERLAWFEELLAQNTPEAPL